MALCFRQTNPLMGVWRMTESVEELLALLDRPEEQAAFLRRVTAESPRLCGCHLGSRAHWHRHRVSFGSSPAHPFPFHDTRGGASHRPCA